MKYYGSEPEILGSFNIQSSEFCFVQYLPIKIKEISEIRIPENLKFVYPLIDNISIDIDYIYLTVKNYWINNSNMNRPGWHSDGFLTNDINYIWYNNNPTEFCIQPFDLSLDHEKSLKEMENQASEHNIITYDNNTLLKLDQYCIHRCNENIRSGYRTFIKISLSNEKYNLKVMPIIIFLIIIGK